MASRSHSSTRGFSQLGRFNKAGATAKGRAMVQHVHKVAGVTTGVSVGGSDMTPPFSAPPYSAPHSSAPHSSAPHSSAPHSQPPPYSAADEDASWDEESRVLAMLASAGVRSSGGAVSLYDFSDSPSLEPEPSAAVSGCPGFVAMPVTAATLETAMVSLTMLSEVRRRDAALSLRFPVVIGVVHETLTLAEQRALSDLFPAESEQTPVPHTQLAIVDLAKEELTEDLPRCGSLSLSLRALRFAALSALQEGEVENSPYAMLWEPGVVPVRDPFPLLASLPRTSAAVYGDSEWVAAMVVPAANLGEVLAEIAEGGEAGDGDTDGEAAADREAAAEGSDTEDGVAALNPRGVDVEFCGACGAAWLGEDVVSWAGKEGAEDAVLMIDPFAEPKPRSS